VRALREGQQMTLAEVENLSGISSRHWQKIEAGEVNLTLVSLHRVCMALSVSVEELFTSSNS
jgi:transcriptional regulator with XRE-family HTH domain